MISLHIRSVALRFGLTAIAMAAFAPLAAQEELPTRTDIPDDLGGVILCPDLASTQRMASYLVANQRGNLDLDRFFKGLAETGCVQDSGPLEILRVLERRDIASVGEGPFMLFEASAPSGKRQFGIVDEAANNRHPRSDFERWLSLHAPDGTLMIESGDKRGFVCIDTAAAERVVGAIPPVLRKGERNAHQVKAFEAAIAKSKCRPATGRFQVKAVHGSAFISLGYEAGAEWTALTVTDAQGREQGMIFDASLY